MKQGLTKEEVEKRKEKYGKNELEEKDPVTKWKVFKRQFSNVLIWILIAAAAISFIANEMLEFYFINAIIGIIATMGFIQEWKAEQAMEQLQEMTEPKITVTRDGENKEILSKNIVPGDIVKLEMGDKIPADAKIIESTDIRIDEAILTGESKPVSKENQDEVYSGTTVVHGRATVKVTKTGMESKLGQIADDIQQEDEESPLQKKVDKLGKKLGVFALFSTGLILALGLNEGAHFTEIIIVTLALAVASIPEGLPLALTLTLSVGMKDMAKKNAIVKKMLAVEGLGSTTTICTDKTGTLTKNEMTVKKLFLDDQEFDVEGSGYIPEGNIKDQNGERTGLERETLGKALKTGLLCNNASLNLEQGNYSLNGEPTEGALVVLGEKTELSKEELEKQYEREKEILFTSERKMMTTVHNKDGKSQAFVKGAPEIVLDKCTSIMVDGQEKQLTDRKKQEILDKNHEFAENALRVLALAYKEDVSEPFDESIEQDLTFVGLAGMIDPARDEVEEAIQDCKKAGIDVKMVTGDNPVTAKAIAADIGLTDNNPKVLTGSEIEGMTEEELEEKVPDVDIYARTQPKHKLHIVDALKEDGEIVAMTGDGVNDAPAVKKADVGIGMGIKGTDVTKESSDMILQDDNFGTIVSAINDGRRIYDNIEKFTTYLVSRNFTEIILIALGIAILGFEFLPLLAIQILFLNVIGEEFPAISLGLDPGSDNLMERPPRNPDVGILHKRNLFYMVSMAVVMGGTSFAVFMLSNPLEQLDLARTTTFITIMMMIITANHYRSLDDSIFEIGMFRNHWLVGALIALIPVILAITYVDPIAGIFDHQPIPLELWPVLAAAAIIPPICLETLKKLAGKYMNTDYMYKTE